jgi:hypothetical protein
MSEPSAPERGSRSARRRAPAPVRRLCLAGVALLTIGVLSYLVIPGAFGIQAAGESVAPGPMPGAPTHRATPTATPPPPGAPQPGSSGAAAAPTALQPSDPAVVRTWNSGSGGQALAAVTAAAGNALMANAVGQYPDMLSYCKALGVAAGNSESAAPIPDVAMQAKYAAALSMFKLAAGNCTAGIRLVPDGVEDTTTEVNHADVNLAATELRSAMSLLYAGTEMLRRR